MTPHDEAMFVVTYCLSIWPFPDMSTSLSATVVNESTYCDVTLHVLSNDIAETELKYPYLANQKQEWPNYTENRRLKLPNIQRTLVLIKTDNLNFESKYNSVSH